MTQMGTITEIRDWDDETWTCPNPTCVDGVIPCPDHTASDGDPVNPFCLNCDNPMDWGREPGEEWPPTTGCGICC